MNWLAKKLGIVVVAGAIVLLLLYYVGFAHYFSLENIKMHAAYVEELVHHHYYISVLIFIGISTMLIACTLPVTAPIAVSAGFLFGLAPAVLYAMVAALVGTAISFLVVRYAMSHIMLNHYNAQLVAFKQRLHAYGYSYLITLQLLTVVPYFIINTLAALAGVSFATFMMTTVIGSLPIVIIYAFAGRQLYMIHSWQDILTLKMFLLLLMLALLALLPLIIKKVRGISKDTLE